MRLPVTIDFETEAIQQRPHYPPKPVGLAVKFPGKPSKYLAWGHPTKNNARWEDAERVLREIWDSDLDVLCHNAKFDLDVAETHFDLVPLPWKRIHDTMFLLFLDNPHAASLSLKPSAERLLGMPPEEQDAVADWLREHKVKIGRAS
jgi:DNA polymerase I-like protein with 3'-5' exonuclease and polymerase domains